MGTRADFYMGRGENAEWLGSIAWDGYPDGGHPEALLGIKDKAAWRGRVAQVIDREDGSAPEHGWPWPWEDSRTTDYAYAFDGGVWISNYGSEWVRAEDWDPDEEEHSSSATFPDMTAQQNVTLGKRSGAIVLNESE